MRLRWGETVRGVGEQRVSRSGKAEGCLGWVGEVVVVAYGEVWCVNGVGE